MKTRAVVEATEDMLTELVIPEEFKLDGTIWITGATILGARCGEGGRLCLGEPGRDLGRRVVVEGVAEEDLPKKEIEGKRDEEVRDEEVVGLDDEVANVAVCSLSEPEDESSESAVRGVYSANRSPSGCCPRNVLASLSVTGKPE